MRFYRKKKIGDIFTEEGLPRPPDEVAYERLEKLQAMNLLKEGKIKEYYVIISEIIRKYLEARYKITVLDKTTYELYCEMRRVSVDKKHISLIKEFLEECDLVKFAKYSPDEATISKDYETARRIIDITKQQVAQQIESEESAI
jgi:hypothetical protein